MLSLVLTLAKRALADDGKSSGNATPSSGYHVYPGQNIQEALDAAATNTTTKLVSVHAGTFRPQSKRQALIWFNRRHNGIRLQAIGEVTLTAVNAEISSASTESYPSVVNHVIYIGEGVSSNTVIEGFRITGANHFVTDKLTRQMEPDTSVPKNLFFYTDGGAIKVFGHSAPVLRHLIVEDNYASPCGAGVSVQQQGHDQDPVSIENCVFLKNRAQVTGAAVDLLEGSAARLVNCLFAGNVSNTGVDIVALRAGEVPFTNSGVLTIFKKSRASVQNCTFTANRNGVDDMGGQSIYSGCIFFNNTLDAGLKGPKRYELDLPAGGTVVNCLIHGFCNDPHQVISAGQNTLNAPDPQFTAEFVPQNRMYSTAGFRPRQTLK